MPTLFIYYIAFKNLLMLIAWIIGSVIIGFIGSDRSIGFWGAFFLSLLLSPLIGVLITLFSETNSSKVYKKKQMKIQQDILKVAKGESIDDKLKKTKEERLVELVDLKSKGLITDQEYKESRKKILL
jgi:phosphate/sulfate permease